MSQQPAARINACSIAVKSLCRSEHRGSAIEATSVHQKCPNNGIRNVCLYGSPAFDDFFYSHTFVLSLKFYHLNHVPLASNSLWTHENRRATDHYTAHWPLMGKPLHLAQRGGAWAGYGPAQSPLRCTKCYSPPINGECTNFISFDVAL